MSLYETPSPVAYDEDLDILLRRWGRWLRAGSSGLSSVGHGGSIRDEEYRDVVAEMLDQVVAQLPGRQKHGQKGAVIAIWRDQQSPTAVAGEWGVSRERLKGIVANAMVWICAGLRSRIDADPSLEAVERWERRQ